MGLIFDIKRYAIHDGPGIRTTVFLKGCALHCRWCHNPESQHFQPDEMSQTVRLGDHAFHEKRTVGYEISPADLFEDIRKDQVFYEESGGGVTFSGGEPLMQPHFLLECLQLCKARKINTCVDTAGVASDELLPELCCYTDIFLYDIKTANAVKFAEYIGEGYDTVWGNLQRIAQCGNTIIIRIPVIPGFNDSVGDMERIVERLKEIPGLRQVNLLPYHRTGSDKYKRLGMTYAMMGVNSLADYDLTDLKRVFTDAGFIV